MSITFDDLEVQANGEGGGRSRRRWVAGVAAAMLIAAAGGVGYGIGRGADTDSASLASPVVTVSEQFDAAPPDTASVDSAVDESLNDGRAVGGASAAESSDELGASGATGYASFGGQPMTLLAERLTDSGFTMRVHLGQTWENGGEFEPGTWQPAPWCYESGQMRVSLAGNGVIDVGSVPWYREPYKGRAVSWLTLGSVDGQPQWVVVAQTPAGTTNVTVTFADGTIDSAESANGIAVLIAPGVAPTEIVEGDGTYWVDTAPEFVLTFEGGANPDVVDSNGVATWNDPEFRAACEPPPPALPDPGEQPDDPTAAEAEITAAMIALYDSTEVLDGDAVYLDDDTGVADARAQVAEGGFSAEASSAQAIIEELVFTEPSTAWFRYRIDTDGIGLTNRYGIAVFVNGEWKITRNTVCQDLSMAGGDCGGAWEHIQPPSAYDGDVGALSPSTVPLVRLPD